MDQALYTEPAAGGRWNEALLRPLAEINEEALEAILAAEPPAAARAAAGLQDRWRTLGASARQQLVRCPYLLVDAGFARPELWAALPRAAVHERRSGAAPAAAGAPPGPRQPLPAALIRHVLHFAWHLVRADPLAARLVLGLTGRCEPLLRDWRIADLEIFAEQRPAWIRARWEERPDIWHAWISAAAFASTRELERLHLWGLQMLAAQTLAASAQSAAGAAGARPAAPVPPTPTPGVNLR